MLTSTPCYSRSNSATDYSSMVIVLKKVASGLGENVQHSLFIVLSHKVIKLFNLRYFNSDTKSEKSILTKNRFDEYN